MVLLGSKAPDRNVEQHDYFFGIATSLKELVPQMKAFWPESGKSLHIDGWREVTRVDDYAVHIAPKQEAGTLQAVRLFFINLGGYQPGKLEEQHYTLLSVKTDKAGAIQHSKKTIFYREQSVAGIKGANAHIDEKYGIDVDDVYCIEELLLPEQKLKYHIVLIPDTQLPEDEIHLGYLQLHKLV